MPTFSRSLEKALHRALAIANEHSHEYATLEHLLLALIEDKDAAAVMRACSVDLDALRRSLDNYLDSEMANMVSAAAGNAFGCNSGRMPSPHRLDGLLGY